MMTQMVSSHTISGRKINPHGSCKMVATPQYTSESPRYMGLRDRRKVPDRTRAVVGRLGFGDVRAAIMPIKAGKPAIKLEMTRMAPITCAGASPKNGRGTNL